MQFTVAELWGHMGLFAKGIVILMLFMSMASIFVLGERLVTYSSSRGRSRKFAAQAAPLIAQGNFAAVQSIAMKDTGYIGRVVIAGCQAFNAAQGAPRDAVLESVMRGLDRQSQREVQTLKRGLGLLATVGSTAPFVGLLGTVMGIITAFQLMADAGSGGLGTVSAGISEALFTTGVGLIVAIPAVVAYNYLQGWVDARAVDISETANEFLDTAARTLDVPARVAR